MSYNTNISYLIPFFVCVHSLCVYVCVSPPPGRTSVKAPSYTTGETSGHYLKNKSTDAKRWQCYGLINECNAI